MCKLWIGRRHSEGLCLFNRHLLQVSLACCDRTRPPSPTLAAQTYFWQLRIITINPTHPCLLIRISAQSRIYKNFWLITFKQKRCRGKWTYSLVLLHIWHIVLCCCDTQGQGVLSDKLRSFSMQDLTLINADDELALHTSDARMRRDPMDEMSSGASTLPRTKSTAARQSKPTQHTHPSLFTVQYKNIVYMFVYLAV